MFIGFTARAIPVFKTLYLILGENEAGVVALVVGPCVFDVFYLCFWSRTMRSLILSFPHIILESIDLIYVWTFYLSNYRVIEDPLYFVG